MDALKLLQALQTAVDNAVTDLENSGSAAVEAVREDLRVALNESLGL